MATIKEFAREMGLTVRQTKDDADLDQRISSAIELTPEQEIAIRRAVAKRALEGIPDAAEEAADEDVDDADTTDEDVDDADTTDEDVDDADTTDEDVDDGDDTTDPTPAPEPTVNRAEIDRAHDAANFVQAHMEVPHEGRKPSDAYLPPGYVWEDQRNLGQRLINSPEGLWLAVPQREDETEAEAQPEQSRRRGNWAVVGLVLVLIACLVIALIATWQNWQSVSEAGEEAVEAVTTAVAPEPDTDTDEPADDDEDVYEADEAEDTVVEDDVEPLAGDGQKMAEEILGRDLPWPPPTYEAGGPGFPEDCAGMCWDYQNTPDGVILWYGPARGQEDITVSPAELGNGEESFLDRMKDGTVHTVIFANAETAQLEICPEGTLDGVALDSLMTDCDRISLEAGWHVIEGNSGFPYAGFGVRFTAGGWASMTEAQIIEYQEYWNFDGATARWSGPDDVEIMMTPGMVEQMQVFGNLDTVVFTTSQDGHILVCNGTVSGAVSIPDDGECDLHQVPAGSYTYNGSARTSAGVSWRPTE